MTDATDILRTTSVVLYVLLGGAAFIQWRRTRGRPAAWAAATFGLLAAVALAGLAVPDDPAPGSYQWQIAGILVALALFPYLLYRFAASFETPPALIERAATGFTIVLAAWSLIISDLPQPGEPRTTAFLAYLAAFVLQWTALFLIVAVRLWRAGRTESSIRRIRMRLMAIGAAGLNLTIVVSGAASASGSESSVLTTQSISILSGVLLLVGLAPPRLLRNDWLRRDGQALQGALLRLMTIVRHRDVADAMLPDAARLVGAEAIALVGRRGDVIGTHGIDEGSVAAVDPGDPRVLTFEMRSARILVWIGPYTSFFGREELDMLRAVAGIVDMALERCDKAADERRFIANAAHELRTPLTTLSGLSVTLATQRDRMKEDEIQECFDALARQGDRTRVLVENLLDLAQLEDGRIADGVPRAVFPAEIAARAIETAPPPAGRSVRIEIDALMTARGDEARVEQMIVNLLTNAYRYGGPHIVISGCTKAGEALLMVTDDGPGVPVEVLPQLFEPFGRGSVGSHEGSGLGLAITRRIAHAYGGDVRYQAERPRGARFTISLPVSDAA